MKPKEENEMIPVIILIAALQLFGGVNSGKQPDRACVDSLVDKGDSQDDKAAAWKLCTQRELKRFRGRK